VIRLTGTKKCGNLGNLRIIMKRKSIITLSALLILVNIPLFPQSDADVTRAINDSDCETLYKFLQDTTGKDIKLVSAAKQALGRYTGRDSAPAGYRTNKMSSKVRGVGGDLTKNVFENPEQHLPAVVIKLMTGVPDSFQKAKILHDWICDNIAYDAKMYFGLSRYTSQDYATVLKKKMAVCGGYAALFSQMCALAGIEAITIGGYSKGFGYTGDLDSGPDHDWNAVKINNKWYLVDVTWDAGYLYGRTFIKNYTTNYLFLDSRPFLYSHLPTQNKLQFYAPAVTKDQFVQEPYISGEFFRYGITLKSDLPHYNNFIDAPLSFEIELRNANVSISYKLRTKSQRDVAKGAWSTRKGSVVTLFYDVPDSQEYTGNLFARIGSERSIWEAIDADTFEQKIIPTLDTLVQNKRITETEKDYFLKSYYKVDENSRYHFLEDQFDTARNNAVSRIHPLVDLPRDMLIHILGFNIRAQEGYKE